MSHECTDPLPGAIAPVLSAAVLAHLQQLNLDYLDLLVAGGSPPDCPAQIQQLPARLGKAIAALPASGRRLLTSLPYTLYSLGFEDAGFWRSACHAGRPTTDGVPIEQRYPVGTASLQRSFCEVALMHAWHVAVSNRLAARVIYAMPDAVLAGIVATPLWRLRWIAAAHPTLLSPRWPTNPAFWPDLVRFASSGDARRFATVKLLGSQLIAAELELAAGRGTRAGASPRLRARRIELRTRLR
jgi:hypothetical protein